MLVIRNFLETIRLSNDWGEYEYNWLVFADWLEEQGDEKAELIRVFFQYVQKNLARLSLTPRQVKALERQLFEYIPVYFITNRTAGFVSSLVYPLIFYTTTQKETGVIFRKSTEVIDFIEWRSIGGIEELSQLEQFIKINKIPCLPYFEV